MLAKKRILILLCVLAVWGLPACTSALGTTPTALPPVRETAVAWIQANRDPDVPSLPFPDNPDPNQCGIPTAWGSDDPAWLTGIYEGELVQPNVLLYDSHSRLSIAAEGLHGAQVQVILYQQNPVLDYYLVKIEGAPKPNEGWVPGPFLSFDPVTKLGDLPDN